MACTATLPSKTMIWGCDDVGDIDIFPLVPHRHDDLGQQLASPANERLPPQIFITTRTLTDEQQASFRVADPENNLVTPLVQPAGNTLQRFRLDLLERLVYRPASASPVSEQPILNVRDHLGRRLHGPIRGRE